MRRRAPALALWPALLGAALAMASAAPARLPAQSAPHAPASAAPVVPAREIRRLPHDPAAFTEGLFIDRGELWESTGMEGRSSIRQVDLESGRVIREARLAPALFGEGIAPWHPAGGKGVGEILSLTWRNGFGFRWNRASLTPKSRFVYAGEGWALTMLGNTLVMSDGTATLRLLDPATLHLRRLLTVTDAGRPVPMLNELEAVDGEILANIWLTDRIARIDPADGHVIGWIDVAALHQASGATGPDQVANGIAWDAAHRRLYITGKEWPALFEIAPPKGR